MKRFFSYVRLAAYLAIIIYVYFIFPREAGMGGICIIRRASGLLCPVCGATRACAAFLHLDFSKALMYHPVFTVSLFPVSLILAVQDAFCIIKRELSGKDNNSLLERVFI